MNERPTIIMIPGTLCDGLLFQSQVEFLHSEHQVIVADSSTSGSLSGQAKEIVNTVKAPSFIVMGLSYGGILAFEILRQFKERVSGLILMNTNHRKPSQAVIDGYDHFEQMIKDGKFLNITSDVLIDRMIHPDLSGNKDLRNRILQMAKNIGIDGFRKQVSAQLVRPDSGDTLRKLACRALIIAGENDRVCPVEWHREMAEMIPDATLEVILNCGHLSTMEKPDEVNNILGNWLKRV